MQVTERREGLLSKIKAKTEALTEKAAETEKQKEKMLRETLEGLKILQAIITEMPELGDYSTHRDVYIAEAGWGDYDLVIHQKNLCYCLSLSSSRSEYELLNEKVVKEFVEEWFSGNSTSSERKLIRALQRVAEIGKDEMTVRMVNSLI